MNSAHPRPPDPDSLEQRIQNLRATLRVRPDEGIALLIQLLQRQNAAARTRAASRASAPRAAKAHSIDADTPTQTDADQFQTGEPQRSCDVFGLLRSQPEGNRHPAPPSRSR